MENGLTIKSRDSDNVSSGTIQYHLTIQNDTDMMFIYKTGTDGVYFNVPSNTENHALTLSGPADGSKYRHCWRSAGGSLGIMCVIDVLVTMSNPPTIAVELNNTTLSFNILEPYNSLETPDQWCQTIECSLMSPTEE